MLSYAYLKVWSQVLHCDDTCAIATWRKFIIFCDPIGKVYTSHPNLYGNATLFCPLRGVLHFKYPQWGMQYFEIAFSRSAESSCDRASRSRVSSHAAERNRWRERACEKMCVGKHHFNISCRYAYTVRDTIYCT